MFVESAFVTREFKEEQIPVLENVTCLCVVNTGTNEVVINGLTIYPSQKQILIVPDGTYSKVQLSVAFLKSVEKPSRGIKKAVKPPKGDTEPLQNRILLIYKKLI